MKRRKVSHAKWLAALAHLESDGRRKPLDLTGHDIKELDSYCRSRCKRVVGRMDAAKALMQLGWEAAAGDSQAAERCRRMSPRQHRKRLVDRGDDRFGITMGAAPAVPL
jgi:hypothetical protein